VEGVSRVPAAFAILTVLVVVAPPGAAIGQVVYRTPQQISRLTASGGRLAWAQQPNGTGCFAVYRGTAAGAAPVRLTRRRCGTRRPFDWMQPWVRIAGAGVFWQEAGYGTTEMAEWIYSTLPGGRRSPALYDVICGGTGGRLLGPIATGALVFSVFTPTTTGDCSLEGGTGVVRRGVVEGAALRRVLVPGAPGAALIAAAGRSLLEVPAAIAPASGLRPTTTLELRGLRSGRLRWSASLPGTPRAVAVSPTYAAALIRPGSGAPAIRAYGIGSGTLARSLAVKGTVLPMLAIAGHRVVFAYPRSIMVWNVRTNALHRLALTPSVRNLSADGRLVVWNTAHTIRDATLRPAA
jgi:hypothetical protein